MPKTCPECGGDMKRDEWSDGAVTEGCWECDYWGWIPPSPVVG